MKTFLQIIGWFGAVAILVAYALISFSILSPQDLSYQLLNIFGSLGILFETLSKRDYQPAVLNFVWILIAIFAVVQILQ